MTMTKRQALAEARRRWGKGAWVRDFGICFRDGALRPTCQEEVDALSKDLASIRADLAVAREGAPKLKDWPGDDRVENYRRAVNESTKRIADLREAEKLAESKALSARYEVGTVTSYGFGHIKGWSYSWEAAFAQAGG